MSENSAVRPPKLRRQLYFSQSGRNCDTYFISLGLSFLKKKMNIIKSTAKTC